MFFFFGFPQSSTWHVTHKRNTHWLDKEREKERQRGKKVFLFENVEKKQNHLKYQHRSEFLQNSFIFYIVLKKKWQKNVETRTLARTHKRQNSNDDHWAFCTFHFSYAWRHIHTCKRSLSLYISPPPPRPPPLLTLSYTDTDTQTHALSLFFTISHGFVCVALYLQNHLLQYELFFQFHFVQICSHFVLL